MTDKLKYFPMQVRAHFPEREDLLVDIIPEYSVRYAVWSDCPLNALRSIALLHPGCDWIEVVENFCPMCGVPVETKGVCNECLIEEEWVDGLR